MTAIVHRIETPSTRSVWAAEGDGQTSHIVLAAQLLTEAFLAHLRKTQPRPGVLVPRSS